MQFDGQITANLPAIDFSETALFYQYLGLSVHYQSSEWMIMRLGNGMLLEFFHHPSLDAKHSWHSACIRVQDLHCYYEYWSGLNWQDWPAARITEIQNFEEISQFCIIDINGSLLRCIQVNEKDERRIIYKGSAVQI
ncbi:hypothetical protein [Acinetobacter sp. ANC 3813]|uniref:hypothetical protein n=1 Tax=Acinetobacter sp. ANC 3813 TaxID=1977873 RepID=UPI000A350493|nr:hypothetical protein [Acinetobacter sp. ANC 3813]OTG91988.1 hypothetical protein B9T34_01170 [Acinetobacter sp. ANC 3813]